MSFDLFLESGDFYLQLCILAYKMIFGGYDCVRADATASRAAWAESNPERCPGAGRARWRPDRDRPGAAPPRRAWSAASVHLRGSAMRMRAAPARASAWLLRRVRVRGRLRRARTSPEGKTRARAKYRTGKSEVRSLKSERGGLNIETPAPCARDALQDGPCNRNRCRPRARCRSDRGNDCARARPAPSRV